MPRWKLIIAAAAAIAGIVATIGLGNWQTHRAEQKAARQAAWDASIAATPVVIDGEEAARRTADRLPQRVRLNGRFVAEATVYVGNRMVDGVAGNYVVTPVALSAEAPWVLVNRGWAPVDMRNRQRTTEVKPVDGPIIIEGIAVERVPRVLELGEATPRLGGVWQNLDFDAYERASGRRVARFVVQQTSDSGDGLLRRWPRPDAGIDKHRGYALQWYGLAAVLAAMTGFAGWQSTRRR